MGYYQIFETLHKALISNSLTRRHQRRFTRTVKKLFHCPDAYGDMLTIAREAKLSAILDIGSYIGDTVARFIDELDLPVFCFEPTPMSFERLRQRFQQERRVIPFNFALSDRQGDVQFNVNQNAQTNSLLENDAGNITSFPEATRNLNTLIVKAQTLDTWTDTYAPDGLLLIKADVQGAEGKILDGGQKTFRDKVVAFYTEVQLCSMYKGQTTFAILHDRLQELGFCLFNLYPCLHDATGKATQTDGLWIKEDFLRQHPKLSNSVFSS